MCENSPPASRMGQAVFVCVKPDKFEFSEVKEMTAYPVINMTATGQNIQQLRKKAGLTVSNLQQIFGFSTPQAIYKWQRGTALPTLDNMVILSVLFNTNINNILIYS